MVICCIAFLGHRDLIYDLLFRIFVSGAYLQYNLR